MLCLINNTNNFKPKTKDTPVKISEQKTTNAYNIEYSVEPQQVKATILNFTDV